MVSSCSDRSIAACLAHGQTVLARVTDRPRLEAALILVNILNKPRTYLVAHPEAVLNETQLTQYQTALMRRSQHVPLPYITGHQEFFGLEFNITPDVLIPRPETELLVEYAVAWARQKQRQSLRIVDVCTGSGCIAVSVAANLPGADMWASDLSFSALAVACYNAKRHGQPVRFIQADLMTPFSGYFDLIISNPPYVTTQEWKVLPASVQQEPRVALVSGDDGLHTIRRLLAQVKARLAPQGCLLMEIGEKQGNAILALARNTFPIASVEILPDLTGKDRMLRILS